MAKKPERTIIHTSRLRPTPRLSRDPLCIHDWTLRSVYGPHSHWFPRIDHRLLLARRLTMSMGTSPKTSLQRNTDRAKATPAIDHRDQLEVFYDCRD